MTDVLNQLSEDALVFNRGVERETLRCQADGQLSLAPHPAAFGSKLTHSMITTDFSESQLELITPVSTQRDETFATLNAIHRFVYDGLDDELLWPLSMPCSLPATDNEIPLAYYGTSNVAQLKTTYRNGLGLRYGRSMQTICAIHYNFSFSDTFWQELQSLEGNDEPLSTYQSRRYFDLMRNFRRFSWLLLYLFGASPVVARDFAEGKVHNFEPLGSDSLHLPYATSLRSGGLGYQSNTQSGLLNICYNGLTNYVETLCRGICTPHETYAGLGINDGTRQTQVNDCILQSEAEFYTSVRAKCVPEPGANFLETLIDGGVEYIEVRLTDLNPFSPIGIDANQVAFLDSLLMYCLLEDSPFHDDALCRAVDENMQRTVTEGRKPGLTLNDRGTERTLTEWAMALMADIESVAADLDARTGGDHVAAVQVMRGRVEDVNTTPSALTLEHVANHNNSHIEWGIQQAKANQSVLMAREADAAILAKIATLAAASPAEQEQIEAADTTDFDTYLTALLGRYNTLLARFEGS